MIRSVVVGLLVLAALAPVAQAAGDPFPLLRFPGGVTNARDLVPGGWAGDLMIASDVGDTGDVLTTLDGRQRTALPYASMVMQTPTGYAIVQEEGLRVVDRRLRAVARQALPVRDVRDVEDMAVWQDRIALFFRKGTQPAEAVVYRLIGRRLVPVLRIPAVGSRANEYVSLAGALGPRGVTLLALRGSNALEVVSFGYDGRRLGRRVVPMPMLQVDDMAVDARGRFAVLEDTSLRISVPGRRTRRVSVPQAESFTEQLRLGPVGVRVSRGLEKIDTSRGWTLLVPWSGRPVRRPLDLSAAIADATRRAGGATHVSAFVSTFAGGQLRAWIDLTRVGRHRYFAYAIDRSGRVRRGTEIAVPTAPRVGLTAVPGPSGPLVWVEPFGGEELPYGTPLTPAPIRYEAGDLGARLTDGSVLTARSTATTTTRISRDGVESRGPVLPSQPSVLLPADTATAWALSDGIAGADDSAIRIPAAGEDVRAQLRQASVPKPVGSLGRTAASLRDGTLLIGYGVSCDGSSSACSGATTCIVRVAPGGGVGRGPCVPAQGRLVRHGDGALLVSYDLSATIRLTATAAVDETWGVAGRASTGIAADERRFLDGVTATPGGGFAAVTGSSRSALILFGPDGRRGSEVPGPEDAVLKLLSAEDGAIATFADGIGQLFTPAQVAGTAVAG